MINLVLAVSTVLVPMRDGVKLSTDIYRPEAEGRYPAVILRTPYNKGGSRNQGEFFSRHGYVFVAQDVRGRFASEGGFYPFVNEGLDGYDTIEWAAAQPWSNGKVGTFGGSYLAWDQYHAAMYRPPHLEAMFALVGGANFIEEFGHPGGAPNLGWALWILNSAATSPGRPGTGPLVPSPAEWLALHPQKRAAVFDPFPAHKRVYEDFYTHPTLDTYWKQRGFHTSGYYREMKDVPIFFVSGWYDYFGEGVLDNFAALSRLQKTPKKLWMGPWPHGTGNRRCGEADFGEAAQVNQNELALDWFDHWMKGAPLKRIGPEPVRIFRMGGGPSGTQHGGEWRTASAWPPAGTSTIQYYLQAGGLLVPKPVPIKRQPASYTYDPDNPVPTLGGRYPAPGSPACVQNQARPEARPDVLTFLSTPLEKPLEVTGKIRARLWVASDAPSTDFTAKLSDVYPDGFAVPLADGVVRLHDLKPGKPRAAVLDLGSTSNLFAAGHRIRVDVSSSNYPRVEPNPNTGEPSYRWTRRVKAQNTLYHDTRSAVELPVRR
jgi:hypothetical protein